MTTFLFTTTSNTVSVEDVDAVEELLQEYRFMVEPDFDGDSGGLSFSAVDEPYGFDVEKSGEDHWVTREFLERLAPFLDETLEVKCVEVQGQGEPSASKWIATPSGDVELITF